MLGKIKRTSPEYAAGGLQLGPRSRGMLGRAVEKDHRDKGHPMRLGVAVERWESPTLPRFFWPVQPRGPQGLQDQVKTNQCTGRSARYAMRSEPFAHDHIVDSAMRPEYVRAGFGAADAAALLYYDEAKKRDPWRDNDTVDEGSTVRAAAKALQALGEIRRYRWAFNIEDLRRGLRWLSVCVVGIDWTVDMYDTDKNGLVRPTGAVDGGHAIAVVGYDDAKFGGAFQLVNSWGPSWGARGFCWVSYEDMAELLKRDGEACAYTKFETDEERGHKGR